MKTLIIVVTFNSRNFIEECIKSIASQEYKDWFLLVIDNNSGDDTVKIVKQLRNSIEGLTPHNFKLACIRKNIGFARAVNYGFFNFMNSYVRLRLRSGKNIPGAQFEHLVLLNPDIILHRGALIELIRYLEAAAGDSGYSVTGGLILDYEGKKIQHLGGQVHGNFITSHIGNGRDYSELKNIYRIDRGILSGSGTEAEMEAEMEVELEAELGTETGFEFISAIKDVDYVTGAFFATSYRCFRNAGGFDTGYRPMYFEELDYCLKIRRAGKKAGVNPMAVARHFEGASVKKFSRNFYKYYHKNRIRCAVINLSPGDFLKKFIPSEIRWLKERSNRLQNIPLAYAYFMNCVFLPYNLCIKLKNHFIINRLRLK